MSSTSTSTSTSTIPTGPLTLEQKISIAQKLKEEGNEFFKKSDYLKSISKYTKIFAYINGLKSPKSLGGMENILPASQSSSINKISQQNNDLIDQLLIQANSNLSAAYLKLQEYKKSIEYSSRALEIDSKHGKSYFRKGIAYSQLGMLDESEENLIKAQEISPDDTAIKAELINLRKRINMNDEKHRKKFAEKFSGTDLSGKKMKQ